MRTPHAGPPKVVYLMCPAESDPPTRNFRGRGRSLLHLNAMRLRGQIGSSPTVILCGDRPAPALDSASQLARYSQAWIFSRTTSTRDYLNDGWAARSVTHVTSPLAAAWPTLYQYGIRQLVLVMQQRDILRLASHIAGVPVPNEIQPGEIWRVQASSIEGVGSPGKIENLDPPSCRLG